MQENWPVAGSSDSMLSINPGCAWIRGKNSLLRAALNSPTLAGSIVQLTMREYMVASLKCLPRCMLGNEERYNPSPAGDVRSSAETLQHRGPILQLRECLRAAARPKSHSAHFREKS